MFGLEISRARATLPWPDDEEEDSEALDSPPAPLDVSVRTPPCCDERHLRRPSHAMIEMVEEALGGAVVVPGSVDGRPGGKWGAGGRDAIYRKWQTLVYNFLERPRGSKAISYHVVV